MRPPRSTVQVSQLAKVLIQSKVTRSLIVEAKKAIRALLSDASNLGSNAEGFYFWRLRCVVATVHLCS
jgi:hypothetical protein